MKLKKTITSVSACVLSAVMVAGLAACGPTTEPEKTVTAISLDLHEVELATGDTQRLTVTATYDDESTATVTGRDVTWTTSDETFASVTSTGIVSGVAETSTPVTITATYEGFSETCAVSVYSLVVELSKKNLDLEVGGEETLTAVIKRSGEAIEDQAVEWSSSNETAVTVDKNGKVTAWKAGEATITAKRANGVQTATCFVTVGWTEPEGYKEVEWAEQNKLHSNVWGYWNAQSGWSQGLATDYGVYTENYEEGKTPKAGYQYIGLDKATFDFEITEPLYSHTYQVFYRSSKNVEGGLLEYNHNYEVTLKVKSTLGGTIHVNPYDDIRAQGKDESDEDYKAYKDGLLEAGKITEHDFELVAGEEKEIKVIFRHDDCGFIYKEGVYDNMGSAIHLQLGDITGGRVRLSVYDIQYKDLGASENPVTCDETKHANYVDPADIPELTADPVALPQPVGEGDAAVDTEKYAITTSDEGKSYNVVYTEVAGGSYDSLYFNVPATAKDNNIFAVTIKNNDTKDMQIRFDIMSEHQVGNSQDLVISSVATKGAPKTDLEWGGTTLNVAAGDTVTLYLTYNVTADKGNPTQIRVLCNTHIYQDTKTYSGNVTISAFTFDTVEVFIAPEHPTEPTVMSVADSPKATQVTLTEENGKAIFNLAGTIDLTKFESKDAAIAWLTATRFDMQQCGGSWTGYAFNRVSVTVDEAAGTFLIKYDITYLDVDNGGTGAYSCHFTEKESSEDGYSDNHYRDLKLDAEHAVAGANVTVGSKKYSIVNNVGASDQTNNWGCVSIKVENA